MNGSHFHATFVEKLRKSLCCCSTIEAVTVPLNDCTWRKRGGTRIWTDSGAQEEDEDEEAAEDVEDASKK